MPCDSLQDSAVCVPLFGGALSVHVPLGWRDASDLRPVPDHQEVWLSPPSESEGTLVIELLEREKNAADDIVECTCIVDHFSELALECGASEAVVEFVTRVTTAEAAPLVASSHHATAYLLRGVHRSAGADASPGTVKTHVSLALVRLPFPLNTDVLMSVSSNDAHGSELAKTLLSTLMVHDPSIFVSSD